jgi:fibronectin type III domain protein
MRPRATHSIMLGRLLGGLLVATLMPLLAIADAPIASSSFIGAEDPLSENGAWTALTSLSPNGTRFQKNNGAYPDRLIYRDHAGARTTAVVPADHYSEIVVGHVGSNNVPAYNCCNNVGPIVRVQASGPAIDSHYLWWASRSAGVSDLYPDGVNALYRIDANGTTYTTKRILPTSPVSDGDRLRLIARGPVIYGIKNGVRDFIYHTGPDTTTYSTGTTGMLAYPSTAMTDAMIASWASGPAPVSSGTWASSTFAGTENPLDEGDRWYPLPGYSGFKKMGGLAIGRDLGHNASGVWSITPPATQYSEVTLGAVASGGGGPIVRIDRNNPGQTGWLLFLSADAPWNSGIFKMTPDGGFAAVRLFTPTIVSGDKWRLTANGNTLDVFKNGVFQFTYTTDGSYATGDVGIEAYTPNFTFMGWEGGDTAGPPATPDTQAPTAPGTPTAIAVSGRQINLMWTAATDNVGVTGYLVERCQGAGCTTFAQIVTVTGTTYNDTGLAANTSYSYRVRATDAAGNLSPYSNVTSATTLPF